MKITVTIHSEPTHLSALAIFLTFMGWEPEINSPREFQIDVQAQFETKTNKHQTAADVMAELAKDINSYHN